MTIEIAFAFLIGMLIGALSKSKDVDIQEQKEIYDKRIIQYEIDLQYYKQLCKWHVERSKQ